MTNKLKVSIVIIAMACLVAFGVYYYIDNYTYDVYDGRYQSLGYNTIHTNELLDELDFPNNYKIISNYEEYKDVLNKVKNLENGYMLTNGLSISVDEEPVSGDDSKIKMPVFAQTWGIEENQFSNDFFEKQSLLLVEYSDIGPNVFAVLSSFCVDDNIAYVGITRDRSGLTADLIGKIYLLPISKNVAQANIEYKTVNVFNKNRDMIVLAFILVVILLGILTIKILVKMIKGMKQSKIDEPTKEKKAISISYIVKIVLAIIVIIIIFMIISTIFILERPTRDKPIIYLYPTETTDVEVKLGNPEQITCSYPKYVDGWKVTAEKNGDLTYLDNNKELYALYYESKNQDKFNISNEGFIVKGEDSARFLEEKLEILGLNSREAEEFIVYWLPRK